jgi:DegV family protein with EDD domain
MIMREIVQIYISAKFNSPIGVTMEQKKIAIVTDSNSGITPNEASELGIFVVPMPFLINNDPYLENVNLSHTEFYKMLDEQANVATSQPSLGDLEELWSEVLKEYDELLHIPMSSGLSQSCASATMLAKDFNGKVQVIDNRRISVTLKDSVLDALKMIDEGKNALEIKSILEKTGAHSSIYIAVDTMKYLKRGGRVTPAAAMIGGILKIKPILQIHGERLDKFALARSTSKAKETMKAAIKSDLEYHYADFVQNSEMVLDVAHTNNEKEAALFCEELKAAFPHVPLRHCESLPLSISCHIGPGALAVACTRIFK